jgi:hypothetical protein
MKRWPMLSYAVLLVAALAFWGPKMIHADPGFSNASFSGTYVFHFSGNGGHSFAGLSLANSFQQNPPVLNFAQVQLPVPTPFAGIGELLADGMGHIATGSNGTIINQELLQTLDVVDHSCDMTFTGTYNINSDGTGTMTLIPNGPCDLSGGAPIPFRIRMAGKGNEGVFISVTPGEAGNFSTIMSGSFAKK